MYKTTILKHFVAISLGEEVYFVLYWLSYRNMFYNEVRIHHGKTKVNPFNSLWFQWHWQSCICYRRDDNTVWTDPAVFLLHYNEHNHPIQTSLEVGKARAHWPDW